YNAAPDPVSFVLPDGAGAADGRTPGWVSLLDTEEPDRAPRSVAAGDRFTLAGRAIAVFARHP
ncbi:MAG: hypothetical protein ACRD1S_12060, partial [Vicinamibacterales bacterium]